MNQKTRTALYSVAICACIISAASAVILTINAHNKKTEPEVSAVAEVGKTYEGKVTSIKEFGAFVEILPGLEGLCHISEFSDKFLKSMDGVCKVGDVVKVKCIDVDEQRGRIKLSRKAAMAELDA